jgi:hypothetical protein
MTLGRDERHENLQEMKPDMFILDENIKMGLEAIEYESVDGRHLAQDMSRYCAKMNMVMSIQVPQQWGILY